MTFFLGRLGFVVLTRPLAGAKWEVEFESGNCVIAARREPRPPSIYGDCSLFLGVLRLKGILTGMLAANVLRWGGICIAKAQSSELE
jgi:hypothetical protein